MVVDHDLSEVARYLDPVDRGIEVETERRPTERELVRSGHCSGRSGGSVDCIKRTIRRNSQEASISRAEVDISYSLSSEYARNRDTADDRTWCSAVEHYQSIA